MYTAKKKWLSNDIFLVFKEGVVYLWDYRNHAQYQISISEFERLVNFSAGDFVTNTTDDISIDTSGILLEVKPTDEWGWDVLSKIFHIGTSHPNSPTPDKPEMYIEYAKSYLDFCKSIHKNEPTISLVKGGEKTLLPSPDISVIQKASLWETLLARHTCRDFFDTSVSLLSLATILYGTLADKK